MDGFTFFVNKAIDAEKTLGQLAGQEMQVLEQQQALRHIEERFEQMVADGHLSPEEMDELRRLFTERDIPLSEVEALYQEIRDRDGDIDPGNQLSGQVKDILQQRRLDLGSDDATRVLLAQNALQEHQLSIEAASNISEALHNAYMASISNLKG